MFIQSRDEGNSLSQSIITFRIPDDEKDLVLEYAKAHNSSLIELYSQKEMEKLLNEI